MAELIVRKLDDAAKQQLAARAARNGRSVEAEARAIIEEAAAGETLPVRRNDEPTFGDFMQAAFEGIALTDEEWHRFNAGIAEINAEIRNENSRFRCRQI